MKRRGTRVATLLVIAALAVASAGSVSASGSAPMSDWSAWQAYFTPIVPTSPSSNGSPAGLPIPTKSPSFAALQAWVNMIPSLPEPAMMAHAEEVARGVDHSTIVGHGPAKGEPASRNAWATGGVLRNDSNSGPFFETFDNFYGQTWRSLPHLWGGYAYRGAESVTLDKERVHKDEAPYDTSYSMKIAGRAGAGRREPCRPWRCHRSAGRRGATLRRSGVCAGHDRTRRRRPGTRGDQPPCRRRGPVASGRRRRR